MQEETQLLVNAIESLKQEPNILKDYIFPISLSFFAALFGSWAGYLSIKRQEKIQLEKSKMDAANKWLLNASDALNSLIAIKNNYHEKLNDNPFQRAIQIPTIILNSEPISEDISNLTFIIPKEKDNEAQKIKWRKISRIKAMIHNYNYVINLWDKRNAVERPIKETIGHHTGQAVSELTLQQLTAIIPISQLSVLIDLTEQTIKLTDDLIIELNDFLSEFPDIAKALINKKQTRAYGTIFTISNPPKLEELLKKTVDVNYEELATLFGETVEEAKLRYSTGYKT